MNAIAHAFPSQLKKKKVIIFSIRMMAMIMKASTLLVEECQKRMNTPIKRFIALRLKN